ncbi:uncharacterized protein I206_107491 [Kwoniella pini CBS 10737]|uniref:Uncharacterized protein n=1 Tax=Kwoniella pini CBS 10737 TaxID=1296096 RepID=A0AAJ8LE39_9TREE
MRSYLFAFLTLLLLTFVQAQPTRTHDDEPGKRVPLRARAARSFKRSLCSTNAECLRKGLPLLRPFRRGTRTRSAIRPRDSPAADEETGSLQVFDANGNSLGYVSKVIDDNSGGYTITTDPTEAVSLSFTSDGSNPFTITISSSDRQAGFPYLGGVFNDNTSNMGTGSSAFAVLGGLSRTISGPAVSDDTGEDNTRQLYGGSETSIFLYDSNTQAITGQWTNTDDTKVDTIFFYGSDEGYDLGMIAPEDYDAFANNFDANPQKVTIKFVTTPTPSV